MLADLLREAPGQQRRDRRPVQGAGGGAARRRCDRAADDLVLAGRPGPLYEAELEDLLPPVRALGGAAGAPEGPRRQRAPVPRASARRVGLDDGAERLVLALGPAARLRRGNGQTAARRGDDAGRGARRGPQGVDAGELPARVPRRAERGDPRALRRRVVYDQRGRS